MTPTRMPVVPSMTPVPDTSVFTFLVRGATSGERTRRSIATNAVSIAAATARSSRVRPEVQPYSLAPWRAHPYCVPAGKPAIPPPYEAAGGVFIPSGCRGRRRCGAQ